MQELLMPTPDNLKKTESIETDDKEMTLGIYKKVETFEEEIKKEAEVLKKIPDKNSERIKKFKRGLLYSTALIEVIGPIKTAQAGSNSYDYNDDRVGRVVENIAQQASYGIGDAIAKRIGKMLNMGKTPEMSDEEDRLKIERERNFLMAELRAKENYIEMIRRQIERSYEIRNEAVARLIDADDSNRDSRKKNIEDINIEITNLLLDVTKAENEAAKIRLQLQK